MNFRLFGKRRAVGLDVGSGSIKALAAERRGSEVVVVGQGMTAVEAGSDSRQITQAVHATLAAQSLAGGYGPSGATTQQPSLRGRDFSTRF